MKMLSNEIAIPKIVTVEIVLMGVLYRMYINDVLLLRQFWSYDGAVSHILTLSEYFGDETSFVLKESPAMGKVA